MKKLDLKSYRYFVCLFLFLFLFQCDTSSENGGNNSTVSFSFAVGAGSTAAEGVKNAGTVYLYDERGNLLNKLNSNEPEADAFFGSKLAISEDRIAVAAFYEDYFEKEDLEKKSGYFDAGAVYLYDKTGKLIKKLRSSNIGAKNYFGSSLAFINDNLVVGCVYEEADKIGSAGVVYLFDKNGDLIKKIVSDKPQEFAEFGRDLVVSEDRIVISAHLEDVNGVKNTGAVYLFDEKGILVRKLVSDIPQASAEFGRKMTIFDDIVVVSSELEEIKGITDSGAVYLFDKVNGNLIKKLTSENPEKDANFGVSIAYSGDKLIIGSYKESVSGVTAAGAVYLYNKSGNLIKKLTLKEPKESDVFGGTIVASDDNIVIGSSRREIDGLEDAGAVYLFDNNGELIQELSSKKPQLRSYFGIITAIKDDMVILGAANEDIDGLEDAGAVYLFNTKGEFVRQLFSDPKEIKGYFGSEIGK